MNDEDNFLLIEKEGEGAKVVVIRGNDFVVYVTLFFYSNFLEYINFFLLETDINMYCEY